jgi:tetratricopeptide (TPR) repeat protein
VTVVGDAGVGKSRLVAEALAAVDARAVRGRCLPYGEGITYWPVVEVVKQLAALPSEPAAAAAIRSLLGESQVGTSGDEIAWAFRKLLEEQAPLVVVLDDIQWGDDTFLDLVESTALLSSGAPLLLLCMARPELVERRPGWPGAVRLEPLAPEEADVLIGEAVPDELRKRIAHAAGGNPLFISEMLAMAAENAEVEVPPTLRALLAARLDQLDGPERRVLERGSVEGEVFHRGAVQALAPDETQVTTRLAALVRHQLVRPDRAVLAGDDGYRFRHLLIRDAAYETLPKAVRADLHVRFADWLDERGQALVERDEIVGYHLEQAARYHEELGRVDRDLALAAGDRLAAAGLRAHRLGATVTAGVLLERALTLTRPFRLDLHLEVKLADALYWSDLARALAIAEAVAERAAKGDPADAALAATYAALQRMQSGLCSPDEVEPLAREALKLLEARGDDDGLVHVWSALSWVANTRTQFEDWAEAAAMEIRHAERAGQDVTGKGFGLALALWYGPRPTTEALAAVDALISDRPFPGIALTRAVMLAALDRIDEAWQVAHPAEEHLRELGLGSGGAWKAEIAVFAGDYEAAASYLRNACDHLEAIGSTGELSTYAPGLGRILCILGRPDEAEPLARLGRELGNSDDVTTQSAWRQTQALVHSARGQHTEAERLAHEAVEFSHRSDSPSMQGNALFDLGHVLETGGQHARAVTAYREALSLYEHKQIIPLARRTRERLVALQPTR